MILNDNSTQQINTLVIQLQNRITNLNNELKSLNKETSDLDSKISDLERRISSNVNDADDMNTEINNLNSKISDLERRISSLAKDAAAMNSAILANTEAISGKADKSHTHTKSEITDFPTSLKNPNALTINGKTYDGSSAIDAGVQTVANGGTGVSTQADINKAFVGDLELGESDVTDGTEFVSSYASDNGFSDTNAINKPYKRKFSKVWNYIKDKIGSVLGLTANNYGGTAATILDYVKGTPIKVRWDGPGINSAEWYPAFSADGSAIEPINRANIHAGTADFAYKIEPNYTSVTLTTVTDVTTKYIKVADCNWRQAGTLQVYLNGDCFEDRLIINFGGGNAITPTLCGHYYGNSSHVLSVIAQKGSTWNSDCSIYVKVRQLSTCNVQVALLKGDCTINISESTTEPTNISEWPVSYGLFGNITAPEITSLEQRVAALESKA